MIKSWFIYIAIFNDSHNEWCCQRNLGAARIPGCVLSPWTLIRRSPARFIRQPFCHKFEIIVELLCVKVSTIIINIGTFCGHYFFRLGRWKYININGEAAGWPLVQVRRAYQWSLITVLDLRDSLPMGGHSSWKKVWNPACSFYWFLVTTHTLREVSDIW